MRSGENRRSMVPCSWVGGAGEEERGERQIHGSLEDDLRPGLGAQTFKFYLNLSLATNQDLAIFPKLQFPHLTEWEWQFLSYKAAGKS